MISIPHRYFPYYLKTGDEQPVSYGIKAAISILLGCAYLIFLRLALPDNRVFAEQNSWVLGAIITVCLLAIYLANDIFSNSLKLINKLEGQFNVSKDIVERLLAGRRYMFSGLFFGSLNTHSGPFPGCSFRFS